MNQRKDGRWVEAITVAPGKRKFLYANSKSELKAKIRALEKEIEEGIDFASDSTFKTWAEKWLKHYEPSATEPQFKVTSSRTSVLVDKLGAKSVKTIKPYEIEEAFSEIAQSNPYTQKPTSQKTLKEYKSVCSRIFAYAIENRVTNFNPCLYANFHPIVQSKSRRALSSEEIKAIENMTGRARFPALVSIYAGLRQGELTALTWEDIDLKNKTIRVNKSYEFKTQTVKQPKTAAGTRFVPINNYLLSVFEETKKSDRHGLVFAEYGHYTTHGLWRNYLTELLIAVDKAIYPDGPKTKHSVCGTNTVYITIEPFDFHCLRHTFATLLYAKGVDAKTAQKWLGHSTLSTTLQIYTHLAKEKEIESSEKWI